MPENYDQYTKVSYSGRKLLEQHSLDEEGLWQIYGEDPNCDFGGSHHEPLLETVTGRLSDVIQLAVKLPRFWQWGGGGRIAKVKVQTIASLAEVAALNERKKSLECQLAEVNKQLGVK